MADLITLERMKIALGLDPFEESDDDDKLSGAIASASQLVRTYTDRKFELASTPPVASIRTYEYNGDGFLDIDDAQSVTAVAILNYPGATPYALSSPTDWVLYPFNGPPYYWIRIPNWPYFAGSPEMGFTRNLDKLGYPYWPATAIVNVTGVWGWTSIPEDVQQAVIWTAAHLAENLYGLRSESIEDYSRSWAGGESLVGADMLPDRAKAALTSYVIPRV